MKNNHCILCYHKSLSIHSSLYYQLINYMSLGRSKEKNGIKGNKVF